MNWSEHIPLVTLLAVVLAAGVLIERQAAAARAFKEFLDGPFKTLIERTLPRMHDRIDGMKSWQDHRDGATGATQRHRIRTAANGVVIPEDDT